MAERAAARKPAARMSAPGRAGQIVQAARELLEAEGPEALTMRRLAERIGVRAPSLYKHYPDKGAVETELIALAMAESAEAMERAEAKAGAAGDATPPELLAAIAAAYRRYALDHPHLYRLMTDRPLPRHKLPPGLEDRAAGPLVRAVEGNEHRARAVWAFAHGMVVLELNERFPDGADLAAAWRTGISALLAG